VLPWAALLGTLGLNLRQHLHGKPTICSVTRRALCRTRHPYATFGAGAFLLGGWFVPHLLRPIRDLLTD
jgi:hypothetical protein